MMLISLIRHAPTPANLRSCYLGSTDEDLAPQGIALAHSVARTRGVQRVHTSALRRTRRTAALLYPGAAIVAHADLNEMDFGVFEGKNWHDLEHDPAYGAWVDSGCEAPCPGGESKAMFTQRCRAAFARVLAEEQEADEVYFVVHGGTIMAILSGMVEPQQDYFTWKPEFCGGFRIQWNPTTAKGTLVEQLASPAQEAEHSRPPSGGRNAG